MGPGPGVSVVKYIAHVWWCGDYACDCTQPVLEKVEYWHDGISARTRSERLWEGTFRSGEDGAVYDLDRTCEVLRCGWPSFGFEVEG